MIVIIDGYNMIGFSQGPRVNDAVRDQFVRKISSYAAKRVGSGVKQAVLVFDGGALRYPEKERRGRLEVVFAGYQESADDWIVGFCAQHRAHECVVITNDRGLSERVMLEKAFVVGVEDFSRKVEAALSLSESTTASNNQSIVEYSSREDDLEDREYLRSLMEGDLGGRVPVKPDDDESSEDCGASSKVKKADRRFFSIFDRL